MADSLRISMIQSHIIWEDRDENLGYYGELLRRVSGKRILPYFPETFTTGFPWRWKSWQIRWMARLSRL